MEELAGGCLHPNAYRALLAMYRLRRSPLSKRMEAAYLFWKIARDESEPMLWEAVKDFGDFPWKISANWERIEAVEAIWRTQGLADPKVALSLANAFRSRNLEERAIDVLSTHVWSVERPAEATVTRLIELLDGKGMHNRVDQLIERFKDQLHNSPDFLRAWALASLGTGSHSALDALVNDDLFNIATLEKVSMALGARLRFFLSGEPDTARQFLRTLRLSDRSPQAEVIQVAALARDLGELNEFRERLVRVFRDSSAILESLERVPRLPAPPDDRDQGGNYGDADDIPF